MSTTAIATRNTVTVPAELQEKVLLGGDLAKLSPPERLHYYNAVCTSVGLNPLTRPFEYLNLKDDQGQDKMILYARKDCTDQLRDLHGVSVEIVNRDVIDGVCVVQVRAKNMTERTDESLGAVPFMKENGEWKTAQSGKRYFAGDGTYKQLSLIERSNAMMKAETKAKRRVTLSICGLGMFDESEIDGMPESKILHHAEETERQPLRTPSQILKESEEQAAADGLDRASSQDGLPPPVSQDALPPSDDHHQRFIVDPAKRLVDALKADPADPYRAKLRTCERTEKAINATYQAIPDELKQNCYSTYTQELKSLTKVRK